MNEDRADAEAVYGSASRGKTDALSDQDILVVDSDVNILKRRRQRLEHEGYSVATYTWKKLEHIAKRQCLFIQHLKLESKILIDRHGRLKATLDGYQPKQNYSFEIAANAEFGKLVSVYPNTDRGLLWVADVLYVAMRNFGVLHLASKQKFVFGYADILESLSRDGVISSSDIDALFSLRELKSIYRSEKDITKEARQRVSLAVPCVPKEVLKNQICAVPAETIVEAWSAAPNFAASYLRVRNLEKLVVAACEIDPFIADNTQMLELRRLIQDPRAYAALLQEKEMSAGNLISRLTVNPALKRVMKPNPVNCSELNRLQAQAL